jgi:Protein of unknown function (DUF4238)
MSPRESHVHHYVPRWYQRRFLTPGQSQFHYLDLHPETVRSKEVKYQRRALLRWGPARCFYKNDLYTLRLKNWSTDQIEKSFFGAIDDHGRNAVQLFGNYNGICDDVQEAIRDLPAYMDAQRFRTPRGLDHLRAITDVQDHNSTLLVMRRAFQFHITMWMEGVWEIVRARQSPTKFIVTDEPVTFFNRRAFPSELTYPEDVGLGYAGTRTLFSLSMDACLIITHTQLVRDPWLNPTKPRVNARSYQPTLMDLRGIQFGRELEEDEVLRINYILKRRATRYIAATEEEWLYPERRVSTTDWSKLDNDWFLIPHLYKVPFTREIIVGSIDGPSWAMDEYGRQPTNPKYRDENLHQREWERHLEARKEWAKKRAGRSVAHVDNTMHTDGVGDAMMQEYLSNEEAVSR